MSRPARFIAAAAFACVVLLGLSAWLHSWGGIVLVVLGAAAIAWYRAQVAEGEADERFFGDMGEETRVTHFQGGSASELPMDTELRRTAPTDKTPPPDY
ncbi:MAG TPA: hypothetical protein VFM98_07580 [Ramlibacter sp.]|uniref:hypothetical protein n=1 Tax=Ramlibacter sp. TaxID=1917967 RepID=UPI002D80A818|nr:hypothetical protein [Ramlibacter sp.]HET8745449.1 hypothetical protein [Ramlibacter sp.]